MIARGREVTLAWAVLGLAVAVCLGWAVFPTSVFYAQVLTPHRLLVLTSALKLAYLLGGAVLAFQCRDRLGADNPARPAWFLLSLGLLSNFAGQLCLAPLQLVRNESPFPSVADIYFLLAYPLLIAALLVLLNAYREAGFPLGSLAERAGIVAGIALVAIVVGTSVVQAAAKAGGDLLERTLTVAYPILDLVLLVPAALLLRVALRLRGSRAGEVWLLLMAGFVFMCAGDALFAYFQWLGELRLDAFLHATYLLGYGLMAGGAHRQLQLLKS